MESVALLARPDRFVDYTGRRLPLSSAASVSRPDAWAALPGNAIGLYHDNNVSLGDPAFFRGTLEQQGLASLLGQFADPLDGRIFGLGVVGAAGADGSGAALTRASAASLASAAPDTDFVVRIAVRADPDAGGDIAGWTAALAASLIGGPSPADRAAASRAWWDAFWARSYFFTDAVGPTPPVSGPRVGSAACTGDAATQAVAVDPQTGALTAPGGLCFYYNGGGSMIRAPCTADAPVWLLQPCAVGQCVAGDAWVVLNGSHPLTVWDMPGANCPWVDTYSQDVPPGQYKNQARRARRRAMFPCASAPTPPPRRPSPARSSPSTRPTRRCARAAATASGSA